MVIYTPCCVGHDAEVGHDLAAAAGYDKSGVAESQTLADQRDCVCAEVRGELRVVVLGEVFDRIVP